MKLNKEYDNLHFKYIYIRVVYFRTESNDR